MDNTVVHFEIPADDPERASKFYRELFGWEIEARDRDHAVELMSKHPGVKVGPFEIRPVYDMTPLIRESEARRRSKS